LNLQIIEKYVRNTNHINSGTIKMLHLSQSKFYLKMIDVSYLIENVPINSSIIETILKNNYIFNNVLIVSKTHIIKVSSKLDMAIVWLDIWNVQSSSKAKSLINQYFNVRSYITTIQGTNMNLDVLQYKKLLEIEIYNFYLLYSRVEMC